MKYLILILLVALPFINLAQEEEKARLTGHVYLISYYQGGVELPPEEYMPQPCQTTLYVVYLKDSLSKPKVIQELTSDSRGRFEAALDPGLYGFVTKNDLRKLRKGQVLPEGYSEQSEYEATNSSWSADVKLPMELKAGEEQTISITHTNTTVCFMCP